MKITLKNNNKQVLKSPKSNTNKFGYTTDNLEKSCFIGSERLGWASWPTAPRAPLRPPPCVRRSTTAQSP